MNKQTILIVEDEQYLRNTITDHLEANHYKTLTASTGLEALTIATSHCPDLILLDLGLPDIDGIEIIQEIRTWSIIPIIVVSGRIQEHEIVLALDSGADDYITKPFGTSELLARIRTAFRHCNYQEFYQKAKKPHIVKIRGLEIDFEKHIVKMNNKPLHLTQIEFKILRLLTQGAFYLMKQLFKQFGGLMPIKTIRFSGLIWQIFAKNLKKIHLTPNTFLLSVALVIE